MRVLNLAKPLNVTLDTKINDTGTLNVTGDVTPQPAAANLNLKLGGIELAAVQPYLAQYTSMTLLAGALSGDTKVRYGAQKPTLQFSGDLSVAGLHTVDNALHEDFINWDRLDVKGLSFQHDPDRLDIDLVAARKLYARVIVEPDDINQCEAGVGGSGCDGGGAQRRIRVRRLPPRPRLRRRRLCPARAARTRRRLRRPAQRRLPRGARHADVRSRKLPVKASQANFADLSVKPNFATGIQNLEGTVSGLSSKENSRAKVDLHGSVDEFSPVAITGEVNALSARLYTDLSMSFKNIELSTFNPYSGKFAGYNISKGKLTTELHYKVDGRKLDAQHHIIVDQLEFGEKTESKDAVSLPVKLAVALLKDRDGVIDLDLPVTGSLDDPKFRLGPIIWKVFVNILEKAVTAPFALLGSLFGGGPDLQFVDFQPGRGRSGSRRYSQGAIHGQGAERAAAVEDRDPDCNGRRSRSAAVWSRRSFRRRSKRNWPPRRRARNRPPPAPGFDQLDPAAQLDLLTKLYKKNFGADPKFPESIDAIKTKPEKTAAKNDYLSHELHEHVAVGESDLAALGQQRATNLQRPC